MTIQARELLPKLYKCFIESDATLLEINPLGVSIDGKLLICDNKINIDDNARFRQKDIFMLEDLSQKNWKEVEAERFDLNYISLDGNIGCMVNGAGLAMATMDLISTKNGRPANFLDVGGRATDDQVVAALRIMDNDPNVESILVNIFAGIARADIIALGLIKGIMETGMKKPIVLRMKGTNIEEAKQIISDSGFNLFLTEDL